MSSRNPVITRLPHAEVGCRSVGERAAAPRKAPLLAPRTGAHDGAAPGDAQGPRVGSLTAAALHQPCPRPPRNGGGRAQADMPPLV